MPKCRESAKMTTHAWSAMLVALPFVLVDAQAQTTVDVTKITCDQFPNLSVASPENIAIWLNGYYHGTQQKTIIELEKLKSQTQDMTSYCLYNAKGGGATAMEAA